MTQSEEQHRALCDRGVRIGGGQCGQFAGELVEIEIGQGSGAALGCQPSITVMQTADEGQGNRNRGLEGRS